MYDFSSAIFSRSLTQPSVSSTCPEWQSLMVVCVHMLLAHGLISAFTISTNAMSRIIHEKAISVNSLCFEGEEVCNV